jgi:hypothetical protein
MRPSYGVVQERGRRKGMREGEGERERRGKAAATHTGGGGKGEGLVAAGGFAPESPGEGDTRGLIIT